MGPGNRLAIIFLFSGLFGCGGGGSSSSSAVTGDTLQQREFVPCTDAALPGMLVRQGFDCAIFVDSLTRPTGLVVDSDGTVLITSSGGGTGLAQVFRYFTDGSQVGVSDFINDPDGVTVDPNGRILVAGGEQVTIVNSFTGGIDTVCASLSGANLQNIASSASGRVAVLEPDGTVSNVVCGEPVSSCAVTGRGARYLAFSPTDEIAVSRVGESNGVFVIDSQCAEISQLAEMTEALGLSYAQGESFGNGLFVADGGADVERVVSIDRSTGDIVDFALGFDELASISFDGTSTLYIAERSRVIKVFPR